MRRRLCEAAARCFAEKGYHRTTIQQVVKTAGVSPGALQHHFRSKDDLVAAVAEHLLGRATKWFARAKVEFSRNKANGRGALADLMRRSWHEQIRTDEYAALLEIFNAARTDKALKKRIRPALAAWRDAMEGELAALAPAAADRKRLEAMLTMSRCAMTGLAVHDSLLDDGAALNAQVDALIAFAER